MPTKKPEPDAESAIDAMFGRVAARVNADPAYRGPKMKNVVDEKGNKWLTDDAEMKRIGITPKKDKTIAPARSISGYAKKK